MVLENGARRFFRRLAEGVFDQEDVIRRSHELAAFLNAAIAEYEIDREQLIAVGYSNGANIASAMILLDLAPFAQAILLRAMVPLTNTTSAEPAARHILISEGEFDPIATPAQGQDLAQRLRGSGAAVDLVFQRSGHELGPDDVAAAQSWLLNKAAL
jgi:phospholipase/carboxylesterase